MRGIVLQTDLQPRVGPVARAVGQFLPPRAGAGRAPPVERGDDGLAVDVALGVVGAEVELAGRERRGNRFERRGEFQLVAAADVLRRTEHGAAHAAGGGAPRRVAFLAEELAFGRAPRVEPDGEGGAVERAAAVAGGELRFLDDLAAPLGGGEGLLGRQPSRVVGRDGVREQQRVGQSRAGGREIEGGERAAFMARGGESRRRQPPRKSPSATGHEVKRSRPSRQPMANARPTEKSGARDEVMLPFGYLAKKREASFM